MADLTCPSCDARGAVVDETAPCARCGAPLLVDGRLALTGEPLSDLGLDAAESAAPLVVAVDRRSGRSQLLRRARPGEDARLSREARILRGLSVRGVPTPEGDLLDDGHVRALVLPHPGGEPLERALERGLRLDDEGGTRFLRGLLGILADLHALSPPVFHRAVNPNAVLFDRERESAPSMRFGIALVDFARATDVVDDAVADPVLARAGYAPREGGAPVAADLYGAAATTVHLLTRTALADLPHDDDGRPQYRARANIGPRLASVLDRLLGVRGTERFAGAREALAALEAKAPTSARRPPITAALVGGGALAVALVAGGLFWLGSADDGASTAPIGGPAQQAPSDPLPVARASDVVVAPPPPAPPAPADEPTPPTPHARPARPHAEAAPPPPSDKARLDALRAAIVSREAELQKCATADDDRWRFTVEASGDGALFGVTPRDKSRLPSTLCAGRALMSLRFAAKSPRPFTSEVTIYVKPSFRVTVF